MRGHRERWKLSAEKKESKRRRSHDQIVDEVFTHPEIIKLPWIKNFRDYSLVHKEREPRRENGPDHYFDLSFVYIAPDRVFILGIDAKINMRGEGFSREGGLEMSCDWIREYDHWRFLLQKVPSEQIRDRELLFQCVRVTRDEYALEKGLQTIPLSNPKYDHPIYLGRIRD